MSDPDVDLPDEAWLVALVSLPGVGPARLSALLDGRTASQAWNLAKAGSPALATIAAKPERLASWVSHCAANDVAAAWEQYRRRGVGVIAQGSPGYPEALLEDPEPPTVLFTRGNPMAIEPVCVGIVGTRQCTRYGIDLARELGGLLAAAGVSVVSGLAAGIDAAAHLGALDADGAAPVAVVGTGLDTPYPRRNSGLWERVAQAGLVCGEAPLGAPVEKWRFPARNRIIAGLSRVVVVVESHERGGSLYTATQAMERAKPVFAVPGPIRSPASAGCNRLLADGCMPLCEPADVLVAVGLTRSTVEQPPPTLVTQAQATLLDVIGWSPVSLDELAAGAGLDELAAGAGFDELALGVEGLVAKGLVQWRGRWVERTAQPTQLDGSNGPGPVPLLGLRPRPGL